MQLTGRGFHSEEDRPATSPFPVDDCSPAEELTEIAFEDLRDHDVLRIETEHHRYQIRILATARRDVLVRGGPFFADWTAAKLKGAAEYYSLYYDQGIYVGRPLIFKFGGKTIATSLVRSLEVCR